MGDCLGSWAHILGVGVRGYQEIIDTTEENYPKFECVVIYQLYKAKDVTKISEQSEI